MAVLAECPFCHKKQSAKNKLCKCGADLVKLKRSKKVKYWIDYRIPGGKPRREPVGYSIEEARDADGKRRGQKRENRIFDMLPDANMTFKELSDWYLGLKTVKKLASYNRIEIALNNFNETFGNWIVNTVKPVDLEDYQEKREGEGMAPATIDMELTIAKTMVTKAFDNDKVDGRTLKVFRTVNRKLKRGSNARKRTITIQEYLKLLQAAPEHLRNMIITAFNTGMRPGELRTLRWTYIDRKAMLIRLPAEATKESKGKDIPISQYVKEVLDSLTPPLGVVSDDHHDFVFTYKGKPIVNAGGLKRSFRTACKKVGIPCGRKTEDGIIMHDFRRTFKTNMLNAGVDKVLRDSIVGHSLKGMDVHYLVPDDTALTGAMDRFTMWLDDQLDSANLDQTLDQNENKAEISNVTI